MLTVCWIYFCDVLRTFSESTVPNLHAQSFYASPSVGSANRDYCSTDRRPPFSSCWLIIPVEGCRRSGESAPVGPRSFKLSQRAHAARDTCRENAAAARLRRFGSGVFRGRAAPRCSVPHRTVPARNAERGRAAADMRRTAGLGASGVGQRSHR